MFDELFDALTAEPPCRTYSDIAERTGWSHGTVSQVLASIRRPAVSKAQGWTVPHVNRGPSNHIFVPVLLDDDRPLNEQERKSVRDGAAATCSHIVSMSQNEGHALGSTAQYLSAKEARQVRRVMRALDGAAAMAEDAFAMIMANGQARLGE